MAWWHGYEPEWQWFHDLPFDYKGIVEFICDFIRSISTLDYVAWMGLGTLIGLVGILIFKLKLRVPETKDD